MIQSPEAPLSFTSRVLSCVSCQEQFAVAEAFVKENHAQPEQRGKTVKKQIEKAWKKIHERSWRQPFTNNSVQTVYPMDESVIKSLHFFDTAVTCPRCDTDNRNWLQLHARPERRERILGISPDRFPMAVWGMFISFALAVIAFALVVKPDLDFIIRRAFILLLAVALTGYLTTMFVTGRWRAQREYRYKRPFMSQVSGWRQLSPVWRAGLPVLPATVVLMPLLLFVILPLSLNIVGLVTGASSAEDAPVRPTIIGSGLDATKETLETLLSHVKDDHEANNQIETMLAIIEELRENPISSSGERVPAETSSGLGLELDRDFLRTWLWFVGGAWVIAFGLALLAVNGFVKRVDSVLPPPLFTSVARMTPVVIREARIALRSNDTITRQIQWTRVERLPDGGVKLIGLHREGPAVEENGRFPKTVRAQRYTIQTDLWCRIVQTDVYDTGVPPAIRPETAGYDYLFLGQRVREQR
jgi:hypothetical protein